MKHYIFTLLLTLIAYSLVAQQTVSGLVLDAQTNTPLESATVYFPSLEKGTLTKLDGKFTLNNLPSGDYKIIVSLLGYITYSSTITIADELKPLQISLQSSAVEIEEVIVSTPFHKLQSENVMKVSRASVKEFKTSGATSLAEGITNLTGVESVTTGVSIGKPVIRGLSANRVLVYTQGIRLENQQYGDEHGLGVNDAGIESVEVIKGPASLLYGSDALGGILYLNPERFEVAGKTSGDNNLSYFSNTQGFQANAGFKASGEKLRFLMRAAVGSHIDYKTGNNERLTNSRFSETDVKTALGYQATNMKTELRYNFNFSTIGIPEEIGEQTDIREPELPFQEVSNHILSSKSDFFFKQSSLNLTLGYINNNRKEFEDDPNIPALFMKLNTFSYNIQYQLAQMGKFETIVGIQGMEQQNENFGEELLIPNATVSDQGILSTAHYHLNEFNDFQFGIRYDFRSINTESYQADNSPTRVEAIDRTFGSFNAAFGYKAIFNEFLVSRVNLASGFRAPNLSELASNGVHEGTNRYEIGNADLENERNIQIDLSLEFKNEHLELFANAFYNKINDFIFIAPTSNTIDGNTVFRYEQENASLYGGEIGIHLHPHPLDWLHLESSYEAVVGKQENDNYLPLIPANTITNTLRVEFQKKASWLQERYSFITLKSRAKQDNITEFETETPAYSLLSIGAGGQISVGNTSVTARITATNVLNKSYISHLSRLKADNIENIGRNINIALEIPL